MRHSLERTTRIALRCTPKERKTIAKQAAKYGLSVSVFIRQAIMIATFHEPNAYEWRKHHNEAIVAWFNKPE